MSVRVSVVVPVYNPGTAIDELIASLDRQTLAQDRFELLLCDDGSDAETQEKLALIARDRPYVRVANLPHSGWPGTPRNHGIDNAAGTYLQFVDQDDHLFPEALERLCDYADAHASDVVIGREVGVGRSLPKQIFRRDLPRATLGKDPILELLTPHKMFRTAFLRENGIRFPDGRVRLEDHLFVMQAYFAAETISVLASVPCYAWVKHPGSASSSRIDPETYFPHLETVLDVVEAHTEPGRLRDRLLRHWYRGKILKRLSAKQMSRYPDEYRQRFLDVVQPLAERRFGPGVDAGLAFPHRVRSALLRADRRDDLLRLAQFETQVECRADVVSARWTRGGGLALTVRVHLVHEGEEALVFTPANADGIRTWRPPSWLEDLAPALTDASRDLRDDRVELYLRAGDAAEERRLAGRGARDLAAVKVSIDPLKAFGPDDETRRAELRVHVRHAGWSFDAPLTADAAVLAEAGRSPFLAGRRIELRAGEDGVVELRREWPGGRLRDAAGRTVRRLRALLRR
ncbi:glycosyltransferase [Microbacterium sp. 179-I 3D4 NHS]|uniref:glycosyltransferase n=1 Tax=Microbacterium sp. 179-I 3D4 NHS TaxID=3142381 RepID=UPI0039A25D8E